MYWSGLLSIGRGRRKDAGFHRFQPHSNLRIDAASRTPLRAQPDSPPHTAACDGAARFRAALHRIHGRMDVGAHLAAGAIGELGLCVSGMPPPDGPAERIDAELSAVSVLRIPSVAAVPGHSDALGKFDAGQREPDHQDGVSGRDRAGFHLSVFACEPLDGGGPADRGNRRRDGPLQPVDADAAVLHATGRAVCDRRWLDRRQLAGVSARHGASAYRESWSSGFG